MLKWHAWAWDKLRHKRRMASLRESKGKGFHSIAPASLRRVMRFVICIHVEILLASRSGSDMTYLTRIKTILICETKAHKKTPYYQYTIPNHATIQTVLSHIYSRMFTTIIWNPRVYVTYISYASDASRSPPLETAPWQEPAAGGLKTQPTCVVMAIKNSTNVMVCLLCICYIFVTSCDITLCTWHDWMHIASALRHGGIGLQHVAATRLRFRASEAGGTLGVALVLLVNKGWSGRFSNHFGILPKLTQHFRFRSRLC